LENRSCLLERFAPLFGGRDRVRDALAELSRAVVEAIG